MQVVRRTNDNDVTLPPYWLFAMILSDMADESVNEPIIINGPRFSSICILPGASILLLVTLVTLFCP